MWEQRPLFISRPSLRQWYSSWLSEDHIFELLSKGISDDLKYGHNLDVTRYIGTVSLASAIWHALHINVAHSWSSGCNIAGPWRLLLQERQDFNFNVNSAVPNDTVDPDIVRERYEEVSPKRHLIPCCHIMHRHFGYLLQHLLSLVSQPCCLLQGGASLRLLHPQRYFPHLAQRMAHLEELFNGCIGCNAYLTPPDCQVCCSSHHLP